MLQGFHLAPSTLLCRLYDTRLEPTHILWETAPAVYSAVICFVSLVGWSSFLVKERPDGSLLAFAWSDVASQLNSYPSHYRMAFAFSIIFYPQLHLLALRPAFPFGRTMGLPRFAFEPKMG